MRKIQTKETKVLPDARMRTEETRMRRKKAPTELLRFAAGIFDRETFGFRWGPNRGMRNRVGKSARLENLRTLALSSFLFGVLP
jgi:hypothetical protein